MAIALKGTCSDIKNKFFEIIKRPYIKRITILGGEPLSSENLDEILQLIKEINMYYPDKAIWLYTGYTWEKIKNKAENNKKHPRLGVF